MTTDCLKSWGSCHKERLIILVDGGMMGTKIKAQSFGMKLGIWSSLHCLLGRDYNIWNISVSDVGWKSDDNNGGGEEGEL